MSDNNLFVGKHPLGELFRQYYLPIRRYLQSKVNNRDIAEDLTAETFERVVRFHHRYREDNIGGWIMTIARNTFINHYRREKRILEASQHIIDTGESFDTISTFSRGTNPEQMTLQKMGLEEMVRMLQTQVPSLHHKPLILREVEGLTYQEIADELAIPVGTVMSRLHRGRKYLARHKECYTPLMAHENI